MPCPACGRPAKIPGNLCRPCWAAKFLHFTALPYEAEPVPLSAAHNPEVWDFAAPSRAARKFAAEARLLPCWRN